MRWNWKKKHIKNEHQREYKVVAGINTIKNGQRILAPNIHPKPSFYLRKSERSVWPLPQLWFIHFMSSVFWFFKIININNLRSKWNILPSAFVCFYQYHESTFSCVDIRKTKKKRWSFSEIMKCFRPDKYI